MADERFSLVEEGRPRATVVVARDLGSAGRAAVDDLVRVVAEMSGASLPVVAEGAIEVAGPQVHIGRTAYVRERGILPDDLPVNGYRIATIPDPAPRLVIAGTNDLGISHGVYDLLTNVLGVLWGMPDDAFEDIPARRSVVLDPLDRTEIPAFGFRVFAGAESRWAARNRLDDGSRILPGYGHGHNLHSIITAEEHGDHPEYFALIDGERHIPKTADVMGPQPCLTHPDVIRIAVEKARRLFDERPHWTTFSLCPNDSDAFCRCPACSVLDDGREPYRGRRITSDSYFHFVDAVAKEVLKTHPDRYLGTYAYWITELTPRRIAHLPPNVVVYLTQDSSQYYDPAYEARDREILDAWTKVADNLAVYEYYELGWFMPRVYPGIVARTLRGFPSANVKGFYCQTNANWSMIGPMLYLAARLAWDTTLDARAVLDEWYRRMFREVAGRMRDLYDLLERRWMTRPRAGRWFEGYDWIFLQCVHWSADVREETWRMLEEAYEAAETPVVRARIAYIRRGQRFAYLFPRAHERLLALRADSADLENELREASAMVNDALAEFASGVGKELVPAYTPTYVEQRTFSWWKAYLGDCIEALLAGKEELRRRLMADDPILAELIAIRMAADDDVKMRIGWAHKEFAHLRT